MPTLGGVAVELDDGERVRVAFPGRFGDPDGPPGVLVVTDRRVLFARSGGWVTRRLYGQFLLDRPWREVVDVAATAHVAYQRGTNPDRVGVTFRDGTTVWTCLRTPVSRDDFDPLFELVEPARDLATDPVPPRRIGEVTARVCSACRPPCSCVAPNLVPAALVGWGRVFAGEDAERRAIGIVAGDPVRRCDVVEISHHAEHAPDAQRGMTFFRSLGEPERVLESRAVIVRLRDERWAYVGLHRVVPSSTRTNPPAPSGGVKVERRVTIAPSLEQLWREGCGDIERLLLAPRVTGEAREEELVRLDAMLSSDDAEARAYAEARMRQIALWT